VFGHRTDLTGDPVVVGVAHGARDGQSPRRRGESKLVFDRGTAIPIAYRTE
jgi:hypothetical protein